MKLLCTLLCCLLLTGCLSRKAKKISDDTKDLLTQVNPATGEHYTPDEIKAIKDIEKESTWVDKLLNEKILIIYAIAVLVFIFGAVICLWQAFQGNAKMFWGAAACGVGVLLCASIPVITILFIEAGKIILYIITGLAIIIACIVAFYVWRIIDRKYKQQLADKETALEGVMSTVDQIKDTYRNEWENMRGDIEQCPITQQAVKEHKAKK